MKQMHCTLFFSLKSIITMHYIEKWQSENQFILLFCLHSLCNQVSYSFLMRGIHLTKKNLLYRKLSNLEIHAESYIRDMKYSYLKNFIQNNKEFQIQVHNSVNSRRVLSPHTYCQSLMWYEMCTLCWHQNFK